MRGKILVEGRFLVKEKFLAIVVFLAVWAVLTLGAGYAEALEKIRLGVDGGPHTEIAEVVREIALANGLEVEIVAFADFVLPNAALADGDIDVNSFQHLPYLQAMIEDRGYRLVPIGNTVLMPMAGYSKRLKTLDELKDGMSVTIPNDPSNGGRALLLLASLGLIELDPGAGILPSVLDITRNDHGLKFTELDAAQLPRALDDTDLAVINTNYALEVGMSPSRDALFVESKDSPYVNVIVVREDDKERPEFKVLVESYQNEEVAKFIEERYQGALLAGW